MIVEPLAVAAMLIGAWAAAALLFRARLWGPRPGTAAAQPYAANPVDVAAALSTGALLTIVGTGLTGPVRVLLALAFVTFVPGWALLGVVPPIEVVTALPTAAVIGQVPLVRGIPKLGLAVALSLTVGTGAAQALLWLHLWRPSILLVVLGALSLLALDVRIAWPRAPAFLSSGLG